MQVTHEHWQKKIASAGIIIGIGLILYGGIKQYIIYAENTTEQLIITPEPAAHVTSDTAQNKTQAKESPSLAGQTIYVDVSGAVVSPGMHKLEKGARVADALSAAGGMDKKADIAWVSRNINLAIILNDGDKIYIPQKNEIPQSIPITTFQNGSKAHHTGEPQIAGITTETIGYKPIQTNAPTPQPSQQSDIKISINSATSAELDTLPGVGPITAKKIIENRPYTTLEELKEKKAVNKATYEKIVDKIKL